MAVSTTSLVPVDQIHSSGNIRFPDEDPGLEALAQSIKRIGLLNPITVRPNGDGFDLVAGHRRLAAAKLAGLTHVEVHIKADLDDDASKIEAQIVENTQRRDITPLELAQATLDLKACGLTQPQIAKAIGASKEYVSKLQHAASTLFVDDDVAAAANELTEHGLFTLTEDRDRPFEVIREALERVLNGQKMDWALSEAQRFYDQAQLAEKLRAMVADLEDSGARVVPKLERTTMAVVAVKPEGTYIGHMHRIDVDVKAHRKEPCHAYCLDTSTSPRLYEVCTDMDRHLAGGGSELVDASVRRHTASSETEAERTKRVTKERKARHEEATSWLSALTKEQNEKLLDLAWRDWLNNEAAMRFRKEYIVKDNQTQSAKADMIGYIEATFDTPYKRMQFVTQLMAAAAYVYERNHYFGVVYGEKLALP